MNTRWRDVLVLGASGVLGLLWLLFMSSTYAQNSAQKIAAEAEKKRLHEVRARIDKLKQDLSKSEESRTEVADQLKSSEKAISEVNRALVELGREQGKITEALAGTQKRILATRSDVVGQQDLLDRLIRHQYMYGNTDQLRLVLDGQDVSVVERHLQYGGYVSKNRAAMIDKLKTTLVTLADLESAAKSKKDALIVNADEQKSAKNVIETERIQRQKVLNRIATDISKSRVEIGRLKRDEDRLTRLVDQLAKALLRKPAEKNRDLSKDKARDKSKDKNRDKSSDDNASSRIRQPGQAVEDVADASFVGHAFKSLQGKLKLPTLGELAARFGTPREDSGVTWKGLFIKSTPGQPVHAVADGNVVYADWLRGYGNLMILDHGNGYLSLYGHNESLLKAVGETVQSGESIASVGSTGGAAESGVYFEMRHDGKPFDPMKWVGK